jgi:hypothetical protein
MLVDRSLAQLVSSANQAPPSWMSAKVITYGVGVRNVTGTVAVVPEVDAAPTSIGAADWHRQIGLKPRAASERRRS